MTKKNQFLKSRLIAINRPKSRPASVLRFSPTAWGKLLYLRDAGDSEVGGFGVTLADDLLFVRDLQLVCQSCTSVSVAFDDEAVADFFDQQVDAGLAPQQFARIWIHTHPGDCPRPSWTDEETFDRVFGHSDWALMFILAKGGATYARLRFNSGPGGESEIAVELDFQRPFGASEEGAWEQEYLNSVRVVLPPKRNPVQRGKLEVGPPLEANDEPTWFDGWGEFWGESLFQDGNTASSERTIAHER